MLLTVAFAAVGVIVARNQPRNPIGWTLTGAALFLAVDAVAGSYAVDVYRRHYHLPLGPVFVFLQPMWAPAIFLFMLSILLFPDGTLPAGRWWRWVIGIAGISGAIWAVGAFAISVQVIAEGRIAIEPSGDLYRIDNPTHFWRWWPVSQIVFFILAIVIALAWLVSCVPAYRRSTGVRRAQLKWLLCGGALAAVGGTLTVMLSGQPGVLGVISTVAYAGLFGVPIAIGVGILKYRLYEIDRLVSRTLSYTLLTGALLLVFVGLVLLTTRVLPFSSPVGVAASTLAAASLYNPLRAAAPAAGRPPLQPRPLRRRGARRRVQLAPAERRRPRHGAERAAGDDGEGGRAGARRRHACSASCKPEPSTAERSLCSKSSCNLTQALSHHSTSFQISGSITPSSPTSAKIATAVFSRSIASVAAAGGVQKVGGVVGERGLAVAVADGRAERERLFGERERELELALGPVGERQVVQRGGAGGGIVCRATARGSARAAPWPRRGRRGRSRGCRGCCAPAPARGGRRRRRRARAPARRAPAPRRRGRGGARSGSGRR